MVAQARTNTNSWKKERPSIFLRSAFIPISLLVLRPILNRIVRNIAEKYPELFSRIGPHVNKKFIIDATNFPFVFVLCPDPDFLSLIAVPRNRMPVHDAYIAGTFLTLLNMLDGQLDGDALFFTRSLTIKGDTEAIVCLRNALDDIDGSIVDEIADLFGVAGRRGLIALRNIKVKNHVTS